MNTHTTDATSPDNPWTLGIARFVSGLRHEDIPAQVRGRIRLLILDALGCALFGARTAWCRTLESTLTAIDDSRRCAVWGSAARLSAPHAALANGTAVQGFELDDVHRAGVLHVGAVVLPGLIALAEERPQMSGKEFLVAAVAGYEIGPRVGLCMGPGHIGQGWHSGATVGVFSAAAGAARALALDEQATVHALGIGGTQASGLMAAQYGAMVKRMHAGRAAQSGLYGALLAERGFTGIRDVLESPYGGFCTTFSNSPDRFDLDQLTAGLGTTWQTMGVALKFYACVGSNHTTLDVIRELRAAHGFAASDVQAVRVHGSQVTMDHVGWPYRPEGLVSAQLNLPFCVATLLIEGDCFVEQFDESVVADPARMALAGRVSVFHDAAITGRGAAFRHEVRVEIDLTDGRSFSGHRAHPRGSEQDFASESDVVAKFERLAREALPVDRVEALRDAVLGLDGLASASTLAGLLAAC